MPVVNNPMEGLAKAKELAQEFIRQIPDEEDLRVVVMAAMLTAAGSVIDLETGELSDDLKAWLKDGLDFAITHLVTLAKARVES